MQIPENLKKKIKTNQFQKSCLVKLCFKCNILFIQGVIFRVTEKTSFSTIKGAYEM